MAAEPKPHLEPADMTYFGKRHSFTVSGDERELDKLRACIRDLEEQLETYEKALREIMEKGDYDASYEIARAALSNPASEPESP